MPTFNIAAVDLGAESGRVFLARYDGANLSLQELHRFPNRPVWVRGHLYWNVLSLWQETLSGLRRARSEAGVLNSVGVDTWGVDYALLDAGGFLLAQPFHYRDVRTQGIMEQVFAVVSQDEIYARTGIQFMPINTLYQLVAHRQLQPALIDHADRFLLMPDLLHMWLGGEIVSERTNATTTQLWSVAENRWASELLEAVSLPTHILPPVVEPGTKLGTVLPALEDELGAGVQIAVPATHDTAAAVAAVPAQSSAGWAYISSGTWSLVGLELSHPLTGVEALHANFTNEGGIFGTVRFLKNVMGLWLLQECRRSWAGSGQHYSYDELFALAATAPALKTFIDPDNPSFLLPGDIPTRIQKYLTDHHQPPLATPGEVVRCILESLVLRYRQVLELAGNLAGVQLDTIHVVGGGAQNTQLNQWLADALGLPVVAGPTESSALGNALMQLVALGELRSVVDMRALAARATTTVVFNPDLTRREVWDEAYVRFKHL